MSDFNLNIWNTNAEAELAAEYQRIATHNPAENTRVFHCGLSSGSTSQSFVSRSSTTFGSRFLRLISFTIANTIHCELPIVLVANDRMGAVRVMIGKVLTSISVDLSTVCIVEIEQALLGQCEQIAAKCTASDGERQAARNIEVRSTYLNPVHLNSALPLLFHSKLTSNPNLLENRRLRTILHPYLSLSRPTHSLHSGCTLPLGSRQLSHFCRWKQYPKRAVTTLRRSMGSYTLAPPSSLKLWSRAATSHHQTSRPDRGYHSM